MESLAHIERQSVFLIETLCNKTKDTVVYLELEFYFPLDFF